MAGPIAFLDANVLYPAQLRNFLMHLALQGAFQPRCSCVVHEEWISNLLANRPDLNRRQLERTRRLMDKHAVGAVVTGYEKLIPGLSLPDDNDRHVLAAAIHSGARVVVTRNLKDFPLSKLRRYRIRAQHPDVFVLHLIELSLETVCRAAKSHRQSLNNPPQTIEQYLDMLDLQGIPQAASVLRHLC